jgi:hypothetical protein
MRRTIGRLLNSVGSRVARMRMSLTCDFMPMREVGGRTFVLCRPARCSPENASVEFCWPKD